jgi:diguanylate cyclase (GGDEF)-like protein/PAS domain S-box-containing protein
MKTALLTEPVTHRPVNLWIAGVCILIFAALTYLVLDLGIEQLEMDLDQETESVYDQLTDDLRSSSNILNGFNAYLHTVDIVDYKNLEGYSRSIREQYPHIYMMQYLVRVTSSEREAFVETRNKEGYATYQVTEFADGDALRLIPARDRHVYYPLVFMDPLTVRTAALLGFDAYSHPVLRWAIDDAIIYGENQATFPFRLYEGGLGYAIFSPVYTSQVLPEDNSLKRELATRLVAVIIRLDKLIDSVNIGAPYNMSLSYLNTSDNSYQQISLGDDPAEENNDTLLPVYSNQRTFAHAGRTFKLTLERQVQWADFNYEWIAFALIATAAISLLIFNFIHLRLESERDRQLAQAALFREKELAEVTLHSIGEAVITTDLDQNIKYMNPIASLLTGWSIDEALHLPLEHVFNLVSEDSHREVDSIVYDCLQKNETVSLETPTLLISKNGAEYAIENSAAPICDHSGNTVGCVLIFRNVTHIRNMSKKMEFQATHDSLTGLINRREFEQLLKNAVQSAREENHQHALCYLDLDQFKVVNDTCGHIAGDQLLRELAKIMPHSIRASDCLARLGGDEFGVLMFDCPLKQAEKVADSLRTAIKDFHFSWDRKTFDIGVSIGLVPINKDSGSLQDILRCADSSCYIAKDLGRNRVHVYTPDDYELVKRHGEMQWLTRIQNAIDENRFQLALQTIQATHPDNELPHKEILLRMQDLEGNIIPPMSFIPAAERYDVMSTLDRWVINTSFQMIDEEHRHNKRDCIYNINLSGQTLCDTEILNYIRSQVDKYNIPAEYICFEITETAVIANLSLAIDFISAMKEIGCKFALDDFGSGLSSFSYLKKLPVDYLKIDGEFVRDILTDPMDRAIVAAINNIGHEMGLKTVAEYVENDSIHALLKDIGVDYVQGYGIDKPHPWYSSANVVPLKKVPGKS